MGSRDSSNSSQVNDVKDNRTSAQISAPTHLFAAGSAAAISAVSTQPLEVLKIRLQANVVAQRNIVANLRHIFRSEGVGGLYRGLIPTLGSVVPSISIYFTLYNYIKTTLGCPTGEPVKDIAMQSASAGIASSATAAITNPLWLVKTRLQAQPFYKTLGKQGVKPGTIATFRSILKEDGVRGLYKGLGASFLASTQAMVQFPIYEELKSVMCSSEHTWKTSTFCYFGASAISASLACILTYPAEVVRARLQAQHGVIRYHGIGHAFRKIWAHEGMSGLYRGLFTSIIKMTPAHAISFTAYEFILRSITTYRTMREAETSTVPEDIQQYTFRPFNFTQHPPNFDFDRFAIWRRYSPGKNPYSFTPSFVHIAANKFPGLQRQTADTCEASSAKEETKRWSEYFW